MAYSNIDDHIKDNQKRLDDAMTSAQARRHVEEELEALKKFVVNHPNTKHDPSSLELFCDSNPEDLACKIFDV